MISPLPGAWPEKPGSATLPFFGSAPVILDAESGVELEGECSGVLCFKQAWPSAMRSLYKAKERFEATYFEPYKGYYFTGDGARRDKDGYYWITGRVDDVRPFYESPGTFLEHSLCNAFVSSTIFALCPQLWCWRYLG